MKSTAVILSAGQGKRMQSPVAKQYLHLRGKPILYYSLAAFAAAPEIDNIVVVLNAEDRDFVCREIIEKYHFHQVTDVVFGGEERYHSVYNGLNAAGASDSDYIFIHDGARPLIEAAIISRAAEAVSGHPAIVIGMPVKDTIKRADCANIVCETPDRKALWAVQTPQVFAAPLIKTAYRLLLEKEQEIIAQGIAVTDDAMAVEAFTDAKVMLVPGSYRNIKVTTPEDLKIAEALL